MNINIYQRFVNKNIYVYLLQQKEIIMTHLIEEYQEQKKEAKKHAKFQEQMEQKYNRSTWNVFITYAPLTTFTYEFESLNKALTFARIMNDDSVKIEVTKNI